MNLQNFKMILYCFSNILHKRNIYFNPKQEIRSIFLIEIFFWILVFAYKTNLVNDYQLVVYIALV